MNKLDNTDNHIFVIFGASGDLTKRKLVPALYSLFVLNLLPDKFILLGVSRSPFKDAEFRSEMKSAILKFKEIDNVDRVDEFINKIFYLPLEYDDIASYNTLKECIGTFLKLEGISGNTLFYLSTPPSLFGIISKNLATAGLNSSKEGWTRLVIEKPFGYDLNSALELKDHLLKDWSEDQIFRIDHYLGKETVQNLLVTRFSNGIFEPLWNRNFIHHVEITSAENIGVGKRGGYYDGSGALRDMVQNHLLQVTALTAMETPSSLEPSAIRYEILKVFHSLRPIKTEAAGLMSIRGQYMPSMVNGKTMNGYRDEEGVNPDSSTETFAALKFYIDNWRWGGVPFYIRTGKRLPTSVTEIVIHFKPTPHFLFSQNATSQTCNQLVLRIQPDEGILMKFGMKTPGAGFEVQNVNMDFHYSDLSHQRLPSAYERLIFDAVKGDATLFARTEEVIEAWKFLTPVLESWLHDKKIPLHGYPSGTWGPEKADELIEGKDMTWRYPCKNLAEDGIYCEL